MYHVSVLSLVPIATDVDLLESSPQQIVCSVVASQTMFVASEMPPDLVSVRKASVQTEDVRQNRSVSKHICRRSLPSPVALFSEHVDGLCTCSRLFHPFQYIEAGSRAWGVCSSFAKS